jgi:hypothetical protein
MGRMRLAHFSALLIPLLASAQATPEDLAQTIASRWTGASEGAFREVYPFREGRADYSASLRAQLDRSFHVAH